MRVKATKMGFYGEGKGMRRHKEGEIFTLADPKHFSSKWMVSLEEKKAESSEEEGHKPRGNPNWRKKEE